MKRLVSSDDQLGASHYKNLYLQFSNDLRMQCGLCKLAFVFGFHATDPSLELLIFYWFLCDTSDRYRDWQMQAEYYH